MKNVLTFLALAIANGSLLTISPDAIALEKNQPIANALSKKINKEIQICMDGGSAHSHAYEKEKHLKIMMPKTYDKCESGVKSACDMKESVLIAMEVAYNKG
jgi:hypothetical protein